MVMIKKVEDWVIFLKQLDKLKKEYGYSFVGETIKVIDNLEKGNLTSMGNTVLLLDLLCKWGIKDLEVAKRFLKITRNYSSFERSINDFKSLKDRQGVDHIALIFEEDKMHSAEIFLTNSAYKKVYLTKDMCVIPQMDLKSGIMKVCVPNLGQYIEDSRNFNSSDKSLNKRTFYTTSLTVRENFPLKEDMDYFDFKEEQMEWFDLIMYHMAPYIEEGKLAFIIDKNKQHFLPLNSFDIWRNYVVQTDGEVYDEYGELLERHDALYKNVKVKNANYLVISEVENGKVVKLNMVVNQAFFNRYIVFLQKQRDVGGLRIVKKLIGDDQEMVRKRIK